MKRVLLVLLWALALSHAVWAAPPYADRFVWIFGWGLGRDSDVAEISAVLKTAGEHGCNGAVVSFGLDTLCQKSPDYFRRLDAIKQACERHGLELIPAIFSVGYGGSTLAHDRNLAEGVPVEDAAFVAQRNEARFVPDDSLRLANGDFEDFSGNNIRRFNFHDQPGEISFVDAGVKHGGKASLRLENFTANPHGHGRIMQEVRLRPHRCYRVSLWVKTEGLEPANAFQLLALAGNRELAPRTFSLPATGDWRKITMLFNSLDLVSVRLYAGVWGGKAGKVWLDDWTIEEIGPLNVLHRPGTPVRVRSEDGMITYTEGKDYAPLQDPSFNFYRVDRDAPSLRLLAGGRIQNDQHLRVSWYHPMVVHDSQVTVCMAEPALYEIFEHEAKLLGDRLHPRRVLLNMDEVRMGGTCRACGGRNMGELLGECITRQAQILRRHLPGLEVYVWSDMLDPNHNAHGDYYLVKGDYAGSWTHVPKDLVIAVWGGAPRPQSLNFFVEQGFRTLVACYYDADSLNEVKGWLDLARPLANVRGFMYTPWQRKYALLADFGDLLNPSKGTPAKNSSSASPYQEWKNGPSSAADFFPIAVWLQSPAKANAYREAGINTYVALWRGPTEEQLAVLKSAGMRLICQQNAVARQHLEDPTIMGWMHGDEPDNAQSLGQGKGYGPPVPPEKIVQDYVRIQEADATRPVMLNLGQGVAWDRWHGRGVRTNHPEDYPEYMKGGDIISFDIYPAAHDSSEVSGKLEFVARGVERLVKWSEGKKVVWNCIECTRISNPKSKATPSQVRAEVWMSLIHGSQGIIYFVHEWQPKFNESALLSDPEMLAAVTGINRQIGRLAPVLNSPSVSDGIQVSSTNAEVPVAVMTKQYQGMLYVFAAGMRNAATRAVFALSETGKNGTVEVLDEQRTIDLHNGRFEDGFQPWEVHLYRWRLLASEK